MELRKILTEIKSPPDALDAGWQPENLSPIAGTRSAKK